ncbi:MAG: ribonuclease P protein component [Thermodesulforhabdaceae bacterium]
MAVLDPQPDESRRKYSFRSHERLRGRLAFDLVKEKGKKVKGRFFIINYMPNNLPFSRLGLVVPKKYYRKAVKRNRLKRCVREWFRLHKYLLASPPKDIVVVVLPGIDASRCREAFMELDRLCGRIS